MANFFIFILNIILGSIFQLVIIFTSHQRTTLQIKVHSLSCMIHSLCCGFFKRCSFFFLFQTPLLFICSLHPSSPTSFTGLSTFGISKSYQYILAIYTCQRKKLFPAHRPEPQSKETSVSLLFGVVFYGWIVYVDLLKRLLNKKDTLGTKLPFLSLVWNPIALWNL